MPAALAAGHGSSLQGASAAERRSTAGVGFGLAKAANGHTAGGMVALEGVMAEGTALIALEPPVIDQPMLVALATRTLVPLGPSGLLQSSLTLLHGAVLPLELRQGKAFLELDGTWRHEPTGTCASIYAPKLPCAERAG